VRLLADRRLTFAAVCLALVVIYLSWWISYASTRQADHYQQLEAGAAFESPVGTARVVTLQQTDRILPSTGDGKPDVPVADAVYVVATVEIVQRQPNDQTWCDVQLISVQRRVWPEDGPTVERSLPDCDDEDIHNDQPYRYEAVFMVPIGDADKIAGVALRTTIGWQRTPILSPPS
jgi:hypothetical protein